jgi:predicted nucleic acid-binding protein
VAVIVDSSIWIDALVRGIPPELHQVMADERMVLSPLVIAEILSGNINASQRQLVGELLQDFPLHPTPLAHWIDVGNLRRMLRTHGINATIPDAHVAQCALDLHATLLTRDEIFSRIASHTTLRLGHLQ